MSGVDACLALDVLCPELEGLCEAPFHGGALLPLVVATRFDVALEAFEAYLGRDLTIVPGDLPTVTSA